LLLVLVTGCARPIPRVLPENIRRVNVPMFESQAFKVGLEEVATQATVDEFLDDGRLTPVPASQADIVLVCLIKRYEEISDKLDDDKFEQFRKITVSARAVAYAPEDTLRREPLMVWDGIESEAQMLSDPRFLGEAVPEDARRAVMASLGREVVRAVLESKPERGILAEELDTRLNDPGPRFQPVESLRERRYKDRGTPPLITGF